jgi:twitching motility protein PilT
MHRIDSFLQLLVGQGGSDLHMVSGDVPRVRLNGMLERVRFRELSVGDVEEMFTEILTTEQQERLAAESSLDFAYQSEIAGRFRVNIYRHVRGIAAAMRFIPSDIPTLDGLGLPSAIRTTVEIPKGLTLVTGPTGSGKSTTLAAMIDHLNQTRGGHIITIEDPIEFVHSCKRSLLTQRELGAHSPSFSEGLRAAIREDPDLILVGEMRDLETITLALTAAETGTQVLATLHTNGAVRSIERIVNMFPARRQDQIRTTLAETLRMVVSQQLVCKADGSGRVAAIEVMINNHAIASMIRTGNSHKITNAIQAGGRAGMQGLDAALGQLVKAGTITGEEAYEHAVDRTTFERFLTQESGG